MPAATDSSLRRDAKVLGLVGSGHFFSHLYMLCLPPLFPVLKAEFGVSYAALGALMTVMHAASGLAQMPVGALVDRIGAFAVLAAGLGLLALATGLMALAPSYGALLALAAVAGFGHSVFHPTDYAIMSSTIEPRRMGRAFSLHTFSGHLGSAVAPATVIFLAAAFGWRGALLTVGVAGVFVLALMLARRDLLRVEAPSPTSHAKKADAGGHGWGALMTAPMLLFFLFFVITSMTSSGISSFSIAALTTLHETPVEVASLALTAYLFASSGGVLIGGQLADRTRRHDLMAAGAFLVAAGVMILIATVGLAASAILGLMAVMGLVQGTVRPARDMMVRAATPRSAVGRAFAFVSIGMAIGGASAPILFGWLVDQGGPRWIFYILASLLLAGVAIVLIAHGRTRKSGTGTAP